MGKKKRGGGNGAGIVTEAAVDALAELLEGAFSHGAVRGVLARCGGDANRALDILLSTALEAAHSSVGPTPPTSARSSSSSATSSGSDGADAKEEQKQRHVGEEGEAYGMVTVASASKGQVAAYKQAAASMAALSIEAEEETASPVRRSTGAHAQKVDSSSDENAVGGVSAWGLLTSMFGGLLPPRALGEAYARVRGQGRGGDEEGDLAAMVQEAVNMLAHEQEGEEDDEDDEDGQYGEEEPPSAAFPPPSLAAADDDDDEGSDDEEEEYSNLTVLGSMFPSLPKPFLRATLASFGDNVDAAAYDLLGGSPPSSSLFTTTAAEQHRTSTPPPKTSSSPPRRKRQQQHQQARIIPTAVVASSSSSPWAPTSNSTSTFALSPPSSSSAAALRQQASGSVSSLFAPAVHSTAAFPHLPSPPPKPTRPTPTTSRRKHQQHTQQQQQQQQHGGVWGDSTAAARALGQLEEVYGRAFDRELIRLLATEVHAGDAAAVEVSLAEMDPAAFSRCRQERERRMREAALLRNLSLSSSSTSTTVPTPSNTSTSPRATYHHPPVTAGDGKDGQAAAAACRREAEVERMAMVAGFKRAAAAFHGKGAQGSAAALIAQGGYAHRAKMQRADAQAAACLLQAQSDPPLSVAVVEGGNGACGVVVTGAKADADGVLRVDLHGLRVREAVQAMESLVPLLGPARVRTLRVITGLGTHSRHGKARLAPAVLRALSSFPQLRVTPDAGAIDVRVRGVRP